MPRTGGNYALPSPPFPFQPDTLANATDVNTCLSDMATALTGSVPTNGAAAWTGSQNANNYNLGGLGTLTATTVSGTFLSIGASGANIGGAGIAYTAFGSHAVAWGWDNTYLHMYIDGTDQGDVATTNYVVAWGNATYLPLTGGTVSGALSVSNNLGVGGTVNVTGGLNVNTNATFNSGLTVVGNALIQGGLEVDNNVLTKAGFTVQGQGIGYSSVGSGTYPIAFAWDGSLVQVYVAGVHHGYISGTSRAMEDRLAALEARVRELEAQLAGGH